MWTFRRSRLLLRGSSTRGIGCRSSCLVCGFAAAERERRFDRFRAVRKRELLLPHDLAVLMALAGDDKGVIDSERCDCLAYRFGAVANLARIGGAFQHFGADRRRVLAARIVVADN